MIQDLNSMLRNVTAAAQSRRNFLRRSGAVVLAGGASAMVAKSAAAASTKKQFVPDKGGTLKTYFNEIMGHENAHVSFLVSALGSAARPQPTFTGLEQATFAKFVETAQVLENTGVGAYLGAAPVIDNPDYLAAAGSILTIEARHAGWLNSILRDPITAQVTALSTDADFDTPLTPAEVVAGAGPFITSLNGGPDVTYDDTTSSPTNDIAILNFALALEYLEAEFYNLNVPKFYKTGK